MALVQSRALFRGGYAPAARLATSQVLGNRSSPRGVADPQGDTPAEGRKAAGEVLPDADLPACRGGPEGSAELGRPPLKYTAIIFGFWMGTRRNLRRFEELHRALGAAMVVSVKCGILFDYKDLSKPRFKPLKAALETQDPLVVHVFSNGGMNLYNNFFSDKPAAQQRVAAMLYDSTPGELSFMSAYRALRVTAFKRFPLARRIPPPLRPALPLAAAALLTWQLWVLLGMEKVLMIAAANALPPLLLRYRLSQKEIVFREQCLSHPVQVPALYLYSSSDEIARSHLVERMIAERRRRVSEELGGSAALGERHVRSRRWDDTAHVAHYKEHPEEYTREVASMLQDALPAYMRSQH